MRAIITSAVCVVALAAPAAAAAGQAVAGGWGGKVDGRWYAGAYAPGGWTAYRPLDRGSELPRYWLAPDFRIADPEDYRLPPAPTTQRWVRYYDDAVLVDDAGRVIDRATGIDWDNPGAMTAAPSFVSSAPAQALASRPAPAAPPMAEPVLAQALPPSPSPSPAPAPAPAPAPVTVAAPPAARVMPSAGATYAPPPPATAMAAPRAYRPEPAPVPTAPPARDQGIGGAAIGAGVGAAAGAALAGRGDRLGGALVGAGVGALAGLAIDKAEDRGAPPPDDAYPPWEDSDAPGWSGYPDAPVPLPPSRPPLVQVSGGNCTTQTVELRPGYVSGGWYYPATYETRVTCPCPDPQPIVETRAVHIRPSKQLRR